MDSVEIDREANDEKSADRSTTAGATPQVRLPLREDTRTAQYVNARRKASGSQQNNTSGKFNRK
jgi:hypothetical protein